MTVTINDSSNDSDTFSDESEDLEGGDTDSGDDSGDDSVTETDTAGMTLIDTLSEDIGAEGTIAGGGESDSLEDSSGDTRTETEYPTETVSSCQFCAQGGAGRDILKSASALRLSGDGNAGEAPLRGSCTRRLPPFVPTVSIEPPPACQFSTALRFTHSALEGSDQ